MNKFSKFVPNITISQKVVRWIVIAFVIVALFPSVLRFGASLNPFFTVEFGTVGVVSRFGKINRLADPGLHTKIPLFEKTTFYTTQKIVYETSENPSASPYYNRVSQGKYLDSGERKVQSDSADMPIDTSTQDGQQVSIRYTLRYQLDPDQILWIAQNIGTQEQVAQRIVQAQSRSVARNIAREFPARELYTGNVFEYQASVESKLKESFEPNGVILDEFLVRQVVFSSQYIAAVEQKQIEQERVKTEEFKAQQEEFKKEQQIIRAEGEARAQEILRETIDPLVLEKMAIEKWDGKLPAYMGGSGEVPFINVN